MREIRDQLSKEIMTMSFEEEKEFFKRNIKITEEKNKL